MSKFMHGGSMLIGDRTIPGCPIPEKVQLHIPTIFQKATEFGLDYFPTVIHFLNYAEISEIAAYDGFPVRYPHWSWGMEYERTQRSYEYGMARIFELVINTDPCRIFCLNSNADADNLLVIAHALGHNDFFKNNIFFEKTNKNMLNQFASNGTKIREYRARWGKEKVTEFIDHVLRINKLIDLNVLWDQNDYIQKSHFDKREWKHPNRILMPAGHEYMNDYINRKDWLKQQREEIEEEELAVELELFNTPTRDIMGFLRDNAPLKSWQADILGMLHNEAMYFAPQMQTKMINEGWASYIDHCLMVREGLISLTEETPDGGIIEYARHKTMVLGGENSSNPYKLGYMLLLDIEERWNKGRFGPEYEACDDLNKRLNWDTKANLGKQKVFEVRKFCNDLTLLLEYFTPEFCAKHNFFNWKQMSNGDVILKNRDFKSIKQAMLQTYGNCGLPSIQMVDPDHLGKGHLLLQHDYEGKVLDDDKTRRVLQSIYFFWKRDVVLSSYNQDQEEIVYVCQGTNDAEVICVSRADYEKSM